MSKKKKLLDLSTAAGLRDFYRAYNYMYFGSKLPENVIVRFVTLKPGCDGSAAESVITGRGAEMVADITINEGLRGRDCVCAWLLVHEMVHVELFMEDKRRIRHGPEFDRRMLRVVRAGALRGIW